MNVPSVQHLIDRVPTSVRLAVVDSGDFQRLASDVIREHVHSCVSELVDRLRNAEGFDDELDQLNPRPDYVGACEEEGIEIVDDNGTFYAFSWKNLTTIEVGDDGKGYIDFPRFAAEKGIDLSAWVWNKALSEPILISDVNDDNAGDVDLDQSLLAGLIEDTVRPDATEVVDALIFVARKMGMERLAVDLGDEACRQELLKGYVVADSSLAVDEFDSKEDAAEHACNEFGINPDYPEVYEYWIVDDPMAYQLSKRGELVVRDFVGLTVWGRTATGQSMSLDGVMTDIVKEWSAEEIDALVLKQFPNIGKHDENLIGVPLDVVQALEDGRVRKLAYAWRTSYGSEQLSERNLVISAADPNKGWLVDRLAHGRKEQAYAGEPLPVAEIEAHIRSMGAPIGDGFVSRPLNQEEIDDLVPSIAHFHEMNGKSALHKVPDNLEARLAKLSPAYGQKLAVETDGPSLG